MAILINKALDSTTEHEYISPENKMTVKILRSWETLTSRKTAEVIDHTNGKRWGLEKQKAGWLGGNGKRGELSRKMVAYLETRLEKKQEHKMEM